MKPRNRVFSLMSFHFYRTNVRNADNGARCLETAGQHAANDVQSISSCLGDAPLVDRAFVHASSALGDARGMRLRILGNEACAPSGSWLQRFSLALHVSKRKTKSN
ncbi:hypothetical protein NDU88_001689 [Pleurodeles waltl]|uniref:Uncharacterized protein n=1 Tax=Pleurodeles waltl TaxID=8319 RepID=A0AAV7TKU0_PLEWA|nr:hypothetical protein NDU88_001689 [Pleurodeles waltl]